MSLLACLVAANTGFPFTANVKLVQILYIVLLVLTLPGAVAEDVALPGGLLEPVEHRTLLISAGESEAYYTVLRQAASVDYERLKAAAKRFREQRGTELPVFVDLFQHPEAYQGQPVTLKGHVRRCVPQPTEEARPLTGTRYEAWLYTEESQNNPAVVVFTSLPEGFPLGDEITEDVAVTGYFFKLYGYRARDTTRLAPLILAGGIEWFPQPGEDQAPAGPTVLIVAVCTAAAGLAALLWFIKRIAERDRRVRGELLRKRGEERPGSELEGFDVLDTEGD